MHAKFLSTASLFLLTSVLAWAEQNSAEDAKLRSIIERQSRIPLNKYSQFRAPSLPLDIKGIEPESAPVQAVVFAVPNAVLLKDRAYALFLQQLAATVVKYADVIWLVGEDNETQRLLLERLRDGELIKCFSSDAPNSMTLIPTPLDSVWLRDFGPVFLRDRHGRVCYADAVYRDILRDETRPRLNDDVAPVYLANHLRHSYALDLKSQRVPLQLWGGDLVSDRHGHVLTSTHTLLMNGGRDDEVRVILKRYYGMETLCYLSPLPGPTVKHLDMVAKMVDDKTIVLGEYVVPADSGEDTFLSYLHHEAHRVLEQNAEIVKAKLPHRVVRMPMPPLKRQLMVAPRSLVRAFFDDVGLPHLMSPGSSDWTFRQYFQLEYALRAFQIKPPILLTFEQIVREIREGNRRRMIWVANANKDLLAGYIQMQDAADERNGESFNEALLMAMESLINERMQNGNHYKYIYQSYLNSLVVNGPRGRLVLVPSYSGESELEELVGAIYRSMYPDSDIVFINCDRVISSYGAIHCVAITVPQLNANPEPIALAGGPMAVND